MVERFHRSSIALAIVSTMVFRPAKASSFKWQGLGFVNHKTVEEYRDPSASILSVVCGETSR